MQTLHLGRCHTRVPPCNDPLCTSTGTNDETVENTTTRPPNTWYADDGAAGGSWKDILRWYEILQEIGPPQGYFPEPEKLKIIVHPTKVEEGKATF